MVLQTQKRPIYTNYGGLPTSPGTVETSYFRESGNIRQDLQSDTIVEQMIVTGNPGEVFKSSAMADTDIASPHPWFPDVTPLHGYSAQAFCVDRTIQHHVRSSTGTERFSLVTFVYKTRPCPRGWEEEQIGTLIPMPMWWSLDPHPRPLTGQGLAFMTIMVPSFLMRRTYPNVEFSDYEDLKVIMDQQGTTNPEPFALRGPDEWLLQNVRAKLLYGNLSGSNLSNSNWELTLIFLGDPVRKHKHWVTRKVDPWSLEKVVPQSNSAEDLEAAHEPTIVYPRSQIDFNDLVPLPPGACDPLTPTS